ncbi:MAG: hypothetical protein AAF492_12530 [Verrucomicrobiota bacterium]
MTKPTEKLLHELLLDAATSASLEDIRQTCLAELASSGSARENLARDLVGPDAKTLDAIRQTCLEDVRAARSARWPRAAALAAGLALLLTGVGLFLRRDPPPEQAQTPEPPPAETISIRLVSASYNTPSLRFRTEDRRLRLQRIDDRALLNAEELPNGVAWVQHRNGDTAIYIESAGGLERPGTRANIFSTFPE